MSRDKEKTRIYQKIYRDAHREQREVYHKKYYLAHKKEMNERSRVKEKETWVTETFGCIKGRVESISSRKSLHFTVYDYNDDHPISCYLPVGSDEKMRDIWGKLVYVEGLVKRDEDTDNVIIIRNISNIEPINEGEPYAWKGALGSIQ